MSKVNLMKWARNQLDIKENKKYISQKEGWEIIYLLDEQRPVIEAWLKSSNIHDYEFRKENKELHFENDGDAILYKLKFG